MKYNRLSNSDLSVSEICLGTMTWGEQNTEQEAHEQLDYAIEQGVNFIDTAELYAIPGKPATQGKTEEYIGSWLKNQHRDKIILATKIAGKGPKWIRNGSGITPENITDAIEKSLKRLQTDYIDLYQLHWPNRGHYAFREMWYYDPYKQPSKAEALDHIFQILEALNNAIKAGKIRHIGLSNETAWGIDNFVKMSEKHSLPRIVSIQNEYSLLHRPFDLDVAESCYYENVGLLAYSSLAMGLLTGKYQNNALPEGSRATLMKNLTGRISEKSLQVTQSYLDLAQKHDLLPEHLALAFARQKPFTSSVIIGATTMAQLKNNIDSKDITLSDEILKEINHLNKMHPLPF